MKANQLFKQHKKQDSGFAEIGHYALVVATVIIGAVVALILISTLFPTYMGAVKNLSANVSTVSTGNTTADALGPVFSLLISLGGLFAIIALVFVAYKLKHK